MEAAEPIHKEKEKLKQTKFLHKIHNRQQQKHLWCKKY